MVKSKIKCVLSLKKKKLSPPLVSTETKPWCRPKKDRILIKAKLAYNLIKQAIYSNEKLVPLSKISRHKNPIKLP